MFAIGWAGAIVAPAMSHTEVERRTVLNDPLERDRICNIMHWMRGMTMTDRVMLVYERNGDSKTTLRIDNGRQYVVTKTGADAAAARPEQTREVSTPLEQTLGDLAELGFVKGVIGRRKIRAVRSDGVEFSLRDVVKFGESEVRVSTLFEAEALNVEVGQEAAALDRVERRMRGIHLTPMSDAAFDAWVQAMHATADRPFEYSPEAAAELAALVAPFAFS